MVLAASDGRIGNMGFVHACPLQLLRFDNSVSVVQEGDYWLALFYQLGHHLMQIVEFRSGSTLLWSTTWSVNIINTTEVVRYIVKHQIHQCDRDKYVFTLF
jgi:hypothetical protein